MLAPTVLFVLSFLAGYLSAYLVRLRRLNIKCPACNEGIGYVTDSEVHYRLECSCYRLQTIPSVGFYMGTACPHGTSRFVSVKARHCAACELADVDSNPFPFESPVCPTCNRSLNALETGLTAPCPHGAPRDMPCPECDLALDVSGDGDL